MTKRLERRIADIEAQASDSGRLIVEFSPLGLDDAGFEAWAAEREATPVPGLRVIIRRYGDTAESSAKSAGVSR